MHLAEKYSHYSGQELDILIHKFLGDYLQYQGIENGEMNSNNFGVGAHN